MAGPDSYATVPGKVSDGLHQAGAFTDPQEWRFAWSKDCTRDAWLEQLPTFGGHGRLPEPEPAALFVGVGVGLGVGVGFTMGCVTVVLTAARSPAG